MTFQRGFAPIVFFLILLVLASIAGVGYYYAAKNQKPTNPVITQTPTPVSSPTSSPDITTNWKTYTITPDPQTGYQSYVIKLPDDLKQIEHSSSFQGTETFQDSQNIYTLIIKEQENLNTQTGKPYTDYKEITGLSYNTLITVDSQQGTQFLPRAGSENTYLVLVFSPDKKLVYDITLKTPSDGSKSSEAGILFSQILSTFKFTDQTSANPTPGEKVCQSDADCSSGESCVQAGPIAIDPVTKKTLNQKTCWPKGAAIPL